MSNDKELEETKVKSEIYQRNFGYILNFEERGVAQDAFSTAWDYQQKIIDKKNKKIDRYKEFYTFILDRRNNDWIFTYADILKLNSLTKALIEVENEL